MSLSKSARVKARVSPFYSFLTAAVTYLVAVTELGEHQKAVKGTAPQLSLNLITIGGQGLLLLENTAEWGTSRPHEAGLTPFEEATTGEGRRKRDPQARDARPHPLAQSMKSFCQGTYYLYIHCGLGFLSQNSVEHLKVNEC